MGFGVLGFLRVLGLGFLWVLGFFRVFGFSPLSPFQSILVPPSQGVSMRHGVRKPHKVHYHIKSTIT